jgi:hypothetical protein
MMFLACDQAGAEVMASSENRRNACVFMGSCSDDPDRYGYRKHYVSGAMSDGDEQCVTVAKRF